MVATYFGTATPLRGGKARRIGVGHSTHGKPAMVWFDSVLRDRGVFTDAEWKTLAVPWAKAHGYRLTRKVVNPYPWLILDTDTDRPDAALCRALNELGRQLKRKLFLNEGLRSRARQLTLWQAALKRYGNAHEAGKWVAVPYTSRHGSGKAADVQVGGRGGPNLFDYPGVRTLAPRLKLVQPMSWEPWHGELAA